VAARSYVITRSGVISQNFCIFQHQDDVGIGLNKSYAAHGSRQLSDKIMSLLPLWVPHCLPRLEKCCVLILLHKALILSSGMYVAVMASDVSTRTLSGRAWLVN
jgi:hypothetical protein